MFEAKYRKYITMNETRFAEAEEMIEACKEAFDGSRSAGIPICYKDGRLFVDNEDNHTLVVGPTGCKKTRVTVYSTIASIIEAGESAVINDPKGEIYRMTSERAKEKGAEVQVLNLRNPTCSHGWNPLYQAKKFKEEGLDDEAQQCVNDFSKTIFAPLMDNTVDNYWGDSASIFLTALILMLMDSVDSKYFNLKTLIPFCYENSQFVLKKIVDKMDQTSTAAFGLRTVIDLGAEKTKSCIYSTLLSSISPLASNPKLLEMLCENTIDVESIGKKQTLIYVIYPDEKESLNFLVNLFITQCYETLVSVAGRSENDRLPVRVNFILDEFSNLAPIENFSNRISEARSKNIRYFILIQSFGQLKEKYSNSAETIISNCNNWICFSSKEMEFLNKISAICGKEMDYNGREKDLISPFAMQYLKKTRETSEVLIIKQGQYPFVSQLPDFAQLEISKKYVQSFDYNEPRIRTVYSLTPTQWYDRIIAKEFKIPFASAA